MLSTVDDYMKFARFLHCGRTTIKHIPVGLEAHICQILKPQTLEMMRQDQLAPRNAKKTNLATHFDGFGLGVSCVVRRDSAGSEVKSLGIPGGSYSSHGTGGWSGV